MKKLLQAIGNIFNLVVLSKEEYTTITEQPPNVSIEPTKPTTLLSYREIVTMLKEYDTKKLNIENNGEVITMNALKYEDARVSTFDFNEVKNYINYVEKIATEKGIALKGLSFVKGVYNEETAHKDNYIGYESLIYLPTTLVNGKETLIDVANSSKNNIVSFKDMLTKNGYEWRYDTTNTTATLSEENISKKQEVNSEMQLRSSNGEALIANFSHVKPPKEQE